MKISVTLKGRKDNLGRQCVYIRLSDAGKRSFQVIKPHIRLLPAELKKGKVIKHPYASLLNDQIRKAILEAENTGFKKESNIKFKDYYKESLLEWERLRSEGTIRYYQEKFKRFTEFAGDIYLTDITTNLLKDYSRHLNLKPNGVWSHMKFLKTIINKAIKEDILKESPFKKFEGPKYKDPPRDYLLREQVEKIKEKVVYNESLPENIRFAGTWFVLSCMTGLRYSDMAKFDKDKNIRGEWLIVKTEKTKEIVSLPFLPVIQELFELIEYKPLDLTNPAYNRLLKVIGAISEIDINLTAHVARHTFGTGSLSSGIPIEYVQRAMGHKSLKTTGIYAKIINTDLAEHYKKYLK
jgi:site-specific recombinase XerD